METTAFHIKIPKQKPIDLAPTALPISDPAHAVREYLISKAELRASKKKPEWDIPRIAPGADSVSVYRELKMVKQRLEETRQHAVQKRADMDKKWEAFRAQEEQLRFSFIRFNSFLKDNKEKRDRAEKKEEKDVAERIKKEDEVEELKVKLETLTEVKNTMDKYVNDYKMYETFLENVCDEYREFSTVFDILNRYDTLALNREVLTARQAQDLSALEDCRSELVKLTEEKSNIMIGLNNQIAELQKRFDTAKSESLHWEASVSRIKNVTAEKTLELERVKTASWGMYQLICRRKEIPIKLAPDNVEGQLNTIKRTIQKVRKIEKIANKEIKKAFSGTQTAKK